MPISRGDVVLLDFPQAPGDPPKRRPAVVLQCDLNNRRLTSSIFAMVTSNIRRSAEPAQVLIDVNSAEGTGTGLVRTSCIKCENLHTLPQQTIIKTIGRLSPPLLQRLKDALKASLELG